MTASTRSTPGVFSRFHGRPWAGAFNVVMATTIVSIAARHEGLETLSIVLLWVAVAAFVSLAALDLWLARHPLALIRRAAQPGQGFHALGFVADQTVLGVRIVGSGSLGLTVAAALLACGWVLWVLILAAVAAEHGRGGGRKPRGEWLLTVVATEGLSILSARIAALEHLPALHAGATVLWIAGGVAYGVVGALLVRRASQPDFGVGNVTPDWWIVMGAPAIWCVAAVAVTGAHPGTIGAAAAMLAWGLASVMLIVIAAADALRANRLGVRFTPERWTMVFPLGMYSVACWALGQALHANWLSELGRAWLAVAFTAWAAVAYGELRHLLAVGRVPASRRRGTARRAG
ncbi:MAG TPA: tellurite resistance/C4-dicarboxylate transporter family protein [Solirubrobacteraceae bacterium]|nr:tellurite resistance/C4-dicarboxylate transporter family protein [Solirubrobacteraceae bacterium]